MIDSSRANTVTCAARSPVAPASSSMPTLSTSGVPSPEPGLSPRTNLAARARVDTGPALPATRIHAQLPRAHDPRLNALLRSAQSAGATQPENRQQEG